MRMTLRGSKRDFRKETNCSPADAITLFWLRWHIEGEKHFLKRHRRLLRRVWEEYREVFPQVDFAEEGQVMLFRLGYGRPLANFIIEIGYTQR